MSVYKPKKSRFWQYDFVIGGERFHGSTGQATRRAAEAVERQKRLEAGTGQFGAVATMTLDAAALRYWTEVGMGRGDARDVERRLEALVQLLGPRTTLGNIDQAAVSNAVERRKKIGRKRGAADDAKVYYPSNATVNRDVIETLRPLLGRARTHWSGSKAPHGLPEIDWRALRLREPRGLSRIYSPAEKARWIDAADEDVRLAVDMLLTYGLRFGEVMFPPAAVDLDSAEDPALTLQKGRKRDVILRVPLRLDHARELAARLSRAQEAELDHLWFYETKVKGKVALVCYTPSQLEYRISKAADRAGLEGGRRIHGARHHAGSTVLKRTGNMKAVQALLGHASISSSQRYAHVMTADLRAALEENDAAVPPEAGQDKATG